MTIWITDTPILDALCRRHAGSKARDDLVKIADAAGCEVLEIPSNEAERAQYGLLRKIAAHKSVADRWIFNLEELCDGDVLLAQFPLSPQTVFIDRILRVCHRKGVIIVLFIHDLELLRCAIKPGVEPSHKFRLILEEKSALNRADYVIAHNGAMAELLESRLGVSPEKLLSLGIFDYLIPGDNKCVACSCQLKAPLVIMGHLSPEKAKYVCSLPSDIPFNLYGVGYEGQNQENVSYFGSFLPDELPGVVDGSFGVVWDGESCETCSGVYGEYLRINNPHKTSAYLAMGLPVLIWDKAALAPFILENGLGVVAPSITEGWKQIQELTELEYKDMRKRVDVMSEKLRSGYFTKRVIASLCEKIAGGGLSDSSLVLLWVVCSNVESPSLARPPKSGYLTYRVDASVKRAA